MKSLPAGQHIVGGHEPEGEESQKDPGPGHREFQQE